MYTVILTIRQIFQSPCGKKVNWSPNQPNCWQKPSLDHLETTLNLSWSTICNRGGSLRNVWKQWVSIKHPDYIVDVKFWHVLCCNLHYKSFELRTNNPTNRQTQIRSYWINWIIHSTSNNSTEKRFTSEALTQYARNIARTWRPRKRSEGVDGSGWFDDAKLCEVLLLSIYFWKNMIDMSEEKLRIDLWNVLSESWELI